MIVPLVRSGQENESSNPFKLVEASDYAQKGFPAMRSRGSLDCAFRITRGRPSFRRPERTGATPDPVVIPKGVPMQKESEWNDPNFHAPLKTFYTVGNDYNFCDGRSPGGLRYLATCESL
jgi:hypothetical protein